MIIMVFKKKNTDITSDMGKLFTTNRFTIFSEFAPTSSSVEQNGDQGSAFNGAHLARPAGGSVSAAAKLLAADVNQVAQITVAALQNTDGEDTQSLTANIATPRKCTEISDVQQTFLVSPVRQNSVTTMAQARKLESEQHQQKQFEKAPVRKSKKQMQKKDQSVQMISQDRNDSQKTIQEWIEKNCNLYDPVKPKRTKNGCPVVVFDQEDVKKWMARQKAREQEQMRGQGLPFDDKG